MSEGSAVGLLAKLDHLEQIASRQQEELHAVGAGLASAEQQARVGIIALQGQIDELEDDFTAEAATMGFVVDAVQALEQASGTIAASFLREVEELHDEVRDLIVRLGEANAQAAHELDHHRATAAERAAVQAGSTAQVGELLATFQQGVTSAVVHAHEQTGLLQAQIDAYLHGLRAELETVNHAYDDLALRIDQGIAAVDGHLSTALRASTDGIQHAFLEEPLRCAESGARELEMMLGALAQGAEGGAGVLNSRVGDLLQSISAVLHVVEQIRPVLELVRDVL